MKQLIDGIIVILGWDQASQWGKKAKNEVKLEKYWQVKRNQQWPGDEERAAEPGDMPLPPFPLPRLHLLACFACQFFFLFSMRSLVPGFCDP